MTTSLDSVTADALKLSADDRAALIERLADSVLPAPPLPSWDAEMARRLAELDAGTVASVPIAQVLAQARALIDAQTRTP